MTLEEDLQPGLEALAPEPPRRLDPVEVAVWGRRRRDRRRLGAVALLLVPVALLATRTGRGASTGQTARLAPSPHATASTPVDVTATATVAIRWTTRRTPGPQWTQSAVVTYSADGLGVDGVGPACPPACGPDSAAPSQTGTWWVDDVAHHRLVEVTRTGQLLRSIAVTGAVEHLHATTTGLVGIVDGDRVLVVDGGKASVRDVGATGALSIAYVQGQQPWLSDGGALRSLPLEGGGLQPGTAPLTAQLSRDAVVLSLSGGPRVRLTHEAEDLSATYAADDDGSFWVLLASGSRSSLVHLRTDGTISQEPGFDAFPARTTAGPSMHAVQGRLVLALPERDGLHLYERTRAAPPLPAVGRTVAGIEADDGDGPPASPCFAMVDAPVTSLLIGTPDAVPSPRCAQLPASRRVRVSNAGWDVLGVRLGRYAFVLQPGESRLLDARLPSYLATGYHHVRVTHGNGVPEDAGNYLRVAAP